MTGRSLRSAIVAAALTGALLGACDRNGSTVVGSDGAPPDNAAPADSGATSFGGADAPVGGGDGGTSEARPARSATARGCAAVEIRAGERVEGTVADTFTWSDAACQRRTTALLRNDAPDAFGQHGGYLRTYTYVADGKVRSLKGTGARADAWNGFGYLVNHYADAYADNRQVMGRVHTVLTGRHHAIHEFKVRVRPGAPVDATVHWVFATGRSHPLFAVTFDARAAGPDRVRADTRAPYGDLAWDDGRAGPVDGLGWGDARKLRTTGPLSARASWSYEAHNVVPHALAWSDGSDAEMGLVATQGFAARPQGGDYAAGALQRVWGKRGTTLLKDIPDWQWPFQINQYELPVLDDSHRLAWGSSYGAVGQRAYQAFGKQLGGYPYQSYTVAVVLGTHHASATEAALREIEAALTTRVTASRGTVATRGAGGAGRDDEVPFDPAGWDPTYAAWTLDAERDGVRVRVEVTGAALVNPVFVLRGYRTGAPPPSVRLDGALLSADQDYFASVDAAGQRLWLTLNRTLEGVATLDVE